MKRIAVLCLCGLFMAGVGTGCESSKGATDPGTAADVPVVDPGTVEDPGTPEDPGAVDPGTIDPGTPEDPGTVDPGTVDPGTPEDPGAVDPGTVDPGPVDPGTVDPGPQGPPGHTEDNGGVMHKPGKNDPLTNCVSCHGAALKGGTGPSCYTCHNNNDHTINRNGHMHKSGGSSTCKTCHGPSNNGGLGPACSKCH